MKTYSNSTLHSIKSPASHFDQEQKIITLHFLQSTNRVIFIKITEKIIKRKFNWECRFSLQIFFTRHAQEAWKCQRTSQPWKKHSGYRLGQPTNEVDFVGHNFLLRIGCNDVRVAPVFVGSGQLILRCLELGLKQKKRQLYQSFPNDRNPLKCTTEINSSLLW